MPEPERKRHHGRQVYSRGPIFLVVEIALLASSVCAIVALVLSLTLFSNRLDRTTERLDVLKSKQSAIQQSRLTASIDTCRTLRQAIGQIYKPTPHRLRLPAILPNGTRIMLVIFAPSTAGQAHKQIAADGLVDCVAHARRLVALSPKH